MTRMRFRPMLYITIFNLLSFFMLFLFFEGRDLSLLYTGILLAAINVLVYIILYHFDFGDIYLFLTVSMLVSIGLVMQYRISTESANKQLLWFMLGIAAYLVTMILFGCIALDFYKNNRMSLCVIASSIALLFQPFCKIVLEKTIWNIIDVAVAIMLVLLWYKNKKQLLK